MMTRQKKDNFDILDQLLVNSGEFEDSQEKLGNSVEEDIERLDAETRNSNIKRDSQNRSKIAIILTWAFVIILGDIIILGPIYNATIGIYSQIDIRDLVESFNSAFGVVLGFVLGYYFKSRSDSDKNR